MPERRLGRGHPAHDANNQQKHRHHLSLRLTGITLDTPIRQVPNSHVKVAFLTDPWGTDIEPTEGLAPTAP